MRGLLALIAIEVVRLAVSRARSGAVTLSRTDARVDQLRRLVDEHFRKERMISFYAAEVGNDARSSQRSCQTRNGSNGRSSDPVNAF